MFSVSGTAVPTTLAHTKSWERDLSQEPTCRDLLGFPYSINPRWVQEACFQSDENFQPIKGTHAGHDEVQSFTRRLKTFGIEEALASLDNELLPKPSVEELARTLHVCADEKNCAYALILHAFMCRNKLDAHPLLGKQLFELLLECECVPQALQVFDKLMNWSDSSLDLLITLLIRSGEPHQALALYEKLQEFDDIQLRSHTYVDLLKVCADFKYLDHGCRIHADISSKGLLKKDVVLGNTVVSMYAKCNLFAKAKEVFDNLPVRNVVSWNTLIAGYAKHGHGMEALNCFERMQQDGISPNAVTFICSLKACASIGAIDSGQKIHAEVARQGFLKTDIRVGNTLLDMYARCGLLLKAQEVFNSLTKKNIVAWNTLIAGYAEHGHAIKALDCFEQMRFEGIFPDAFTFACCLKACGSIRATDKGLALHAEISKNGLVENNYLVASALLDMYAKCGLLAKAQDTFDKLPFRDVISWTSLIAGYAEHGPYENALSCFEMMQCEGISPNAVTFLCSLKACSGLGATAKGIEIHSLIAKEEMLERDLHIGSALVDMYVKCGSLAKAQEVFDKLSARDIVTWNSLLAGYAQIGESENVFLCFDRMTHEGIKPNLVTFLVLLNVCNHLGLVDKGQDYFEAMSDTFAIIPTIEHLACMVDLLGRSGQLEKLIVTIKKLPKCPDKAMWLTILSACRKWRNVELGRWAFEQAVQLDTKDPSAYVCMSMMYADAGMQEDASKIKLMRVENQA